MRSPAQSPPPATDPSTLTDEQLLSRLQRAISEMGDGSTPDPDAPFYTLGLSSMTGAQFSGLLEQVCTYTKEYCSTANSFQETSASISQPANSAGCNAITLRMPHPPQRYISVHLKAHSQNDMPYASWSPQFFFFVVLVPEGVSWRAYACMYVCHAEKKGVVEDVAEPNKCWWVAPAL